MNTHKNNSAEEINILEKVKAREIVQVILDYGVTQNQIYDIIYFLALELENNNNMKLIVKTINNLNQTPKSSIIEE